MLLRTAAAAAATTATEKERDCRKVGRRGVCVVFALAACMLTARSSLSYLFHHMIVAVNTVHSSNSKA